ncbi:MAG TPA: amidase family protein [Vicinamibacterales bacterium]|nr:amidase family protein [Vicinamibacterales bacterium]
MKTLLATLAAATTLAAQAPQVGLIGPLPPAAPASAFDVTEKTIVQLLAAQRIGTVTSHDLVEKYLARIKAYDQDGPRLNAMIALNPGALEQADALDAERRAGRVRGPLHGIPIVVKDNYATADMPTTAGSLALAGFQTGRDAFMVKKLRDAGAVVIGKTNLHELAYGITTISSAGGQTRNPYDPTRNPGGSSGGTGAAVTASFAAAGMGTDTCGSIRNPSSENSLWGLRGTIGLSSRDGIVPLAHSQDIGGPLARTVGDLLLMLDTTVGVDAADPITRESQGHIPRTYNGSVGDAGLGDVTIGILRPLFGSAPEDEEVARIVRSAVDEIGALGAGVVDVPYAGLDDLLRDTSVINAEFKFDLQDFLARFPAAPVHSLADILGSGKYHQAVEGVLKRASDVASRDSESYRASLSKRERARAAILALMKEREITAFVYPTLRRKPAEIGQPQNGSNCQLSAATGLPAMSMPAGFTADGLPVGMDLLGQPWSEPALLKVAYAYERAVAPRKPPKTTPPLGAR